MGSQTFYYTDPFGSGVQQTITLDGTCEVSDLNFQRVAVAGMQRNGYGGTQTVFRGQTESGRIAIEQVAEGRLLNEIAALCEALRHGASCGYTTDSAKNYFAYTSAPRVAGDTVLFLSSPGATLHGLGTAALASGDGVRVESLYLGGVSEGSATSGTVTATQLTMTLAGTQALRFTHPIPGWVRYQGYYPVLRLLPSAQPTITYDRSTALYDVAIPLVPDWGAVENLRPNGGIVWTGTTPFEGVGRTVDDLLAQAAGGESPRFFRGA